MRLVAVVMGTSGPNPRAGATSALLNHAFRFYESHIIAAGQQPLIQGKVWKGASDAVSAGLLQDLKLAIPRGSQAQLEKTLVLEPRIVAPVQMHAAIGTFSVRLNGKELASRPLVALQAVEPAGFFGRIADDVRLMFE
jgi:D-alanyl-D-alanine carboxypeptidase (penicillin-binding protein 5/6)